MKPDMHKTRSEKILRRILAAVNNEQDTGDVISLMNSEVIELINKQFEDAK